MIFLKLRHLGDTGSHDMVSLSWSPAVTELGMVLFELKGWSCFRNISLATSEDDTIIVVTLPSRRDMSGPWTLARLAKERWGLDPSSSTLPIMGIGFGPGGKGNDLFVILLNPSFTSWYSIKHMMVDKTINTRVG